MSTEAPSPLSRLDYTGDIVPLVGEICDAYGIGEPLNSSVIEVGYEDCNVIIETEQGRYLAKMFAKTRAQSEINRYADTIRHVVEAGVNHPAPVLTPDGAFMHRIGNVSLALMRYVEGKTFYGMGRLPTDEERRAIVEQAAKINQIDYRPPYLFDTWAIPHIGQMFKRVRQFIAPEDLELVEWALREYYAIPIDTLPRSFVHGDIIKTNTIKGDDDKLYIIDFSVANWYPRIQELAVMAANLLHEEGGAGLAERCEVLVRDYEQFSPLTDPERRHLYAYALAGIAMEFMGSHQEKYINGYDTDETNYWLQLGRQGLRRELSTKGASS